jgi:hypothetical protein
MAGFRACEAGSPRFISPTDPPHDDRPFPARGFRPGFIGTAFAWEAGIIRLPGERLWRGERKEWLSWPR